MGYPHLLIVIKEPSFGKSPFFTDAKIHLLF